MVPPLLQKLIWLTVASSFFVMFEPAPCDVLLGLTLIVAAADPAPEQTSRGLAQ
jgi:hypothetical protein